MTTSTVFLSDSRVLAYIDYDNGPSVDVASPRPVIFYCHGFPGSRLEGALLASSARSHNARVIAVDRPGMGLSTFQPNRTVLDWPRDVLELADHLQIKKFYILGASGGAPYALACVHALPRDRLLGCCVMAGIYPTSLGTAGMSIGSRALLWISASKWLGGLAGWMLDMELGQAAYDREHPERLREQFVRDMKTKPALDAKCLEKEGATDMLVEALRESFRQGREGVATDLRLISSDWGFELQDLKTEGFKIDLWHGKEDANIPVAMAEKAAALMAGVKLKVIENAAHLSASMNHQDELLKSLLLN